MKSYIKRPRWSFYWSCSWKWYKKPFFQKSYSLSEPQWKDKYDTPRCEWIPYININCLGIKLNITRGNNSYWERWLWIHKYYNGNEELARNEWPWTNYETKKSSWFKDKI